MSLRWGIANTGVAQSVASALNIDKRQAPTGRASIISLLITITTRSTRTTTATSCSQNRCGRLGWVQCAEVLCDSSRHSSHCSTYSHTPCIMHFKTFFTMQVMAILVGHALWATSVLAQNRSTEAGEASITGTYTSTIATQPLMAVAVGNV